MTGGLGPYADLSDEEGGGGFGGREAGRKDRGGEREEEGEEGEQREWLYQGARHEALSTGARDGTVGRNPFDYSYKYGEPGQWSEQIGPIKFNAIPARCLLQKLVNK